MSASGKIRHIVRLREMLRQWRKKAAATTARGRVPPDVPTGHVAVTVGSSCRRFVVRATHLNHPVFAKLLEKAEEEFGFTNSGPLFIPCDESLFEEVLRYLSRPQSDSDSDRRLNLAALQRPCSAGVRSSLEIWDSRPGRPILHGV
ncbi:unnamed protein product [Cuscuta epithymum]|uniref:Uncharacterized protein n=1 Tax=Cuscuta epithymum TaxID=186058 RepID=A0AAV0FRV7_9ASTE|nr:unnamed protein product [Cuscuta epithymum]